MKRTRQEVRDLEKERWRKKAVQDARVPSRHAVERISVNVDRLNPGPHGFRGNDWPEFVARGYYVDQPFQCKDCGMQEVWTARQQKWWYETAQGSIMTAANRCRPCRRRERERKVAARKVHLEGVAKKERGA